MLSLPCKDGAYTLVIDACQNGVGAALFQKQDNDMRVIGYASRSTTDSESRSSATELETLALKYALVQFHYLLFGNHVCILTDHKPLVSIVNSKTPLKCKKMMRLLSAINEYDITVSHIPGSKNCFADMLSRVKHDNNTHSCMAGEDNPPPRRSSRLAQKHKVNYKESKTYKRKPSHADIDNRQPEPIMPEIPHIEQPPEPIQEMPNDYHRPEVNVDSLLRNIEKARTIRNQNTMYEQNTTRKDPEMIARDMATSYEFSPGLPTVSSQDHTIDKTQFKFTNRFL